MWTTIFAAELSNIHLKLNNNNIKRTKKTCMWLHREEMISEAEAILMVAHDHAIMTNAVNVKFHKQRGCAQ